MQLKRKLFITNFCWYLFENYAELAKINILTLKRQPSVKNCIYFVEKDRGNKPRNCHISVYRKHNSGNLDQYKRYIDGILDINGD